MIKTITVTEDAYTAMKSLKLPGESFSELFLRISNKTTRLTDVLNLCKEIPAEAITAWEVRVKEIHEKLGKAIEEKIHAHN